MYDKRLTKQERKGIKSARRSNKNIGTHETEKYLVAAQRRVREGITISEEQFALNGVTL